MQTKNSPVGGGVFGLEIYRVAFIGHREVDEHRQVADELDTVLSMLLKKHEYIEFYVGKNGEFDELAASAVRRLKSEWSAFCSLALVLPYEIAKLDLIEKSYDEVIMPNDYKCHYKAAIEKRNRWLAENCDLMIIYIERENGGAYKCYKYARELGVQIVNIADKIHNEKQ